MIRQQSDINPSAIHCSLLHLSSYIKVNVEPWYNVGNRNAFIQERIQYAVGLTVKAMSLPCGKREWIVDLDRPIQTYHSTDPSSPSSSELGGGSYVSRSTTTS